MTRINLLPWREELRKQQTKDFVVYLSLVLILAASLVFVGHKRLTDVFNKQENRIKYIQKEMSDLKKDLVEIAKLEDTKKELLSRMRIVQELQGGRPKIVHFFQEISGTTPDGVVLKKIIHNKDDIEVEGEANSNAGVSSYMKNISSSPWFSEPKLAFINTDPVSRNSLFQLNIDLIDAKGKGE
jgi:type IV pilus assembly protein PilN